MHYRKSCNHLVWSFWASPATNLENRSQERTRSSYLPSSMFDQVGALSPISNSCPPTSELLGSPSRLFWEPMKIHDIRWNFEKFLVGPDGKPIMRWYHRTPVSNVKMDILAYMREQAALGVRGK
uniref:Glutathione peroxidase 3 n=1 Tax=Myotis myotis TaxID=51298 RepID=A0A7J7XHF0_MYOMY|nr:hypothetical protein mMyoMyo1_011635 [Myotis myotis]